MRTVLMGILALAGIAAAPAAPTNAFNAKLRQLDPLSRMAAIRRAVTTSGGPCRRVTQANDDGLYHNLARWSVRCGAEADYALFLGPGGEVQLRGCDEAMRLRLPACTLPPQRVKPAAKPLVRPR